MLRRFMMVLALCGTMGATTVWAQQDGGNRPERSGDRNNTNDRGGGRGNWDPAQMRERMVNNLKEQLGTNDDEWKVIEPKIEKVVTAARDMRPMGMWGRRGGGPGGGGPIAGAENNSPVALAASELRQVLENKNASSADINAKLTALRAARAKAREDLTVAQNDLKSVLTPRQEAVLVGMGMLD